LAVWKIPPLSQKVIAERLLKNAGWLDQFQSRPLAWQKYVIPAQAGIQTRLLNADHESPPARWLTIDGQQAGSISLLTNDSLSTAAAMFHWG